MPSVILPDGHKLNFPDNMGKEEIQQAIFTNFPQYRPKGDLATELASKDESPYPEGVKPGMAGIKDDIKNIAENFPKELAKNIKDYHAQYEKNPVGREMRDVAVGATSMAGGARDLLLSPLRFANYLREKEIPGMGNIGAMAKAMSDPFMDTGLQKRIIGEEQPGDKLTEMAGSMMSPAPLSKLAAPAKTAAKTASTATKSVLGKAKSKIPSIKSNKIGDIKGNIKELESQLKEAGLDDDSAKYAISQMQEDLETKFGTSGTGSLQTKILSEKEKIGKNQPLAEKPKEPTENLLPDPNQFSHKDLEASTSKQRNMASEALTSHLEPGKEHDVAAGKMIKEHVAGKAKDIQKNYYKPIDEALEGQKIKLSDNTKRAETIASLKNFFGDGAEADAAVEKALSKFDDLEFTKDVDARHVFDLYKSTRDSAKRAKNNAYERGISETERQKSFKKAEFLEKSAKSLRNILQAQAPEEVMSLLDKGDSLWRDNVAKYYGTKVYEDARAEKGISTKDIIENTRGAHEGHQALRDLINNNSDLAKSVLAHKHANKPEGLLKLSKAEQEALKASPKTKRLVEELRQAEKNQQIAQEHSKAREAEIQQLNEAFVQKSKQQKLIKKAERDIKLSERKIRQYQAGREKLQNALKNKELTSGQKKAIQGKLDEQNALLKEAEAKQKELRRNVKTAMGAAAIIFGTNKAASILKKLF
jgi:hypothetical protein